MVKYDIDVLTEICWLYSSSVFIVEEMTVDFHLTRAQCNTVSRKWLVVPKMCARHR